MHRNQDHQYHDQRLPGTLAHLIAPFRQPQHLWEGTWVALCHGVFVLGLGILSWLALDFKFQGNTDIVSWVTVHRYPKYQEIVAYIGAFFCVLAGVVSGLYCWCLLALIFQRWRNYSVSSSLRYAALSFSGYLAGAFFIILGRWNFTSLFLIPMGLVLLTIVIFLFWPIPFLKPQHQPPSSGCAFPVSTPIACQTVPPGGSFWSYPGKSPRFLILVVIPVLLYVFYFNAIPWLYGAIDFFHEGERLAPLNTLLRGGLPFRDIYIQHGLFQNVGKPWLAAQLSEPSLASWRLTEAFFAPVGYMSLYFLGLQVFRFWPTAIFLCLLPSQNLLVSDRHAFGFLALAVLASGIRHSYICQSPAISLNYASLAPGRFAGAGILTTLAFFFSVDTGLFTLAACLGFLMIQGLTRYGLRMSNRWLPLGLYLAGVLITCMPFLLYFGWAGILLDFFSNTYIQCSYQAIVWGLPFPPLLPILKKLASFDVGIQTLSETCIWYITVAVNLTAAAILAFRFVKGRFWESQANAILLLVLLFGAVRFYTALGRSDFGHLAIAAAIPWILSLYAVEYFIVLLKRYLPKPRSAATKVFLALAIALAIGCFGIYVSVINPFLMEQARSLVTGQTLPKKLPVSWERLGGVQIGADQYSQLRRLVAFIQQHTAPDETIFDFSNQGALYFFADRPSPSRYHQIAYVADARMQLELIRDLEKANPRLVIYSTGGWFDKPDGIPNAKRQWLVEEYIQTHFTKKVTLDNIVILLK